MTWPRRVCDQMLEDDLIDAATLARVLEVTTGAIRQKRRRGEITPVRKGPHGTWLYRRSEVLDHATRRNADGLTGE